MRVNALRIPCRDLTESEQFYGTLLGRSKSFGDAGVGYIGFGLDNVTVLLEYVEPGEFEGGRYLGFSLEVPDIEAFYAELVDKVAFTGPPEKQAWGGIMTHVRDVSDNTLSIVQMLEGA